MIYADHNSTTPMHDSVREAMQPFLTENYGNPSSLHRLGRNARIAVRHARERVASLAGVEADDVRFTSGGTEANNAAIFGLFEARASLGKIRVIASAVEHASVRAACQRLKRLGAELAYVRVDRNGVVDLDQLDDFIHDNTAFVSVMHANNEIGTVQPIVEIADLAAQRGVPFHVDAVQSFGKLDLKLSAASISLVTCSAHKIGGPKGAGMLIARNRQHVIPWLMGGKQEFGVRGGTENVAAIVGFGEAAKLRMTTGYASDRIDQIVAALRYALRQRVNRICEVTPEPRDLRLPNTLTVCFEGVAADRMVLELDRHGIYVSSGSACSSGSAEPSHVLLALGVPAEIAKTAVRFSFGPENSIEDAWVIADHVPRIVNKLRGE